MSGSVIFRNSATGESLEVTPEDSLGSSAVIFEGRVVERILYSDISNTVTFEDGRQMRGGRDFACYLAERLARGAYRQEASA